MIKDGNILLEVLCDDLLRDVAEPVGHLGDVIRCIADGQCDRMGSTDMERRDRAEIAVWKYLEQAEP